MKKIALAFAFADDLPEIQDFEPMPAIERRDKSVTMKNSSHSGIFEKCLLTRT